MFSIYDRDNIFRHSLRSRGIIIIALKCTVLVYKFQNSSTFRVLKIIFLTLTSFERFDDSFSRPDFSSFRMSKFLKKQVYFDPLTVVHHLPI